MDEIYMTAVQMMTGGGGWPLSVFLTPELAPFFGGAYFPPEDRRGLPSFLGTASRAVADLWQNQPERVRAARTPPPARAGGAAQASSAGGLLDASLLRTPRRN